MDMTDFTASTLEIGKGGLSITCLGVGGGLRIEGHVDGTTAPLLAQALASAMNGRDDTYADLGGVRFIDVGGLRALAVAAARLQGGLTLLSVPPHVLRLLSLTGWDRAPGLRLDGQVSEDPAGRPQSDAEPAG
ncbi:STAS domain-containing protein [Planotetraspora sp. GP83]|uniref:STAS domain-containing protein n=1 Tax=Planotetraspora sp. GP83 TaxID=3156264 RepID=UPI003512D3DA